ncbi:MAG: hypothetical protein IJM66_11830 [Muribaculaceae bacterium]|nr:hypothetical protein [Muribaculaceae bacterium]
MRKFFTLLMAVAMVATVQAQVQFNGRATKSHLTLNREKVSTQRGGFQNQMRPKALGNLISEQPEGEVKQYVRSGFGFTVSDGTLFTTTQDAKTSIVYDADGTTVYIKNIVNGMSYDFGDSWAVGTLSADGTTITVSLEQTVGWSWMYDVGIRLAWGRTVINDEGTMVSFERDETVTEAVYVIDGETISLQGTSGATEFQNTIEDFVAEGLTCVYEDDGAWPGYLEWNTVLTEREPVPVPEIITEQPAGELHSYIRSGANIYQGWDGPAMVNQSGMADVVFDEDGETVYLRDVVYEVASNVWVKGTINADRTKITVPMGQYLYWDENGEFGMVLQWMSTNVETTTDEEGNEQKVMTVTVHQGVPEATYTIDGETISLDNCSGDPNAQFPSNFIATGLGVVYNNDLTFCAMDFNTVYNEFHLVPAVPADPVLYEDSWFDSGEEDGYSCFDFTVLAEDVDGNYIDPTHLVYSIFTDDDVPFVFDAATYSYDLTEDMTDIPYEIYSSGYDFDMSRIYFYRTNMGDNPMFTQRIGIQVHYDVPVTSKGRDITIVRNSSNIVYWELPPSAISEVRTEPTTTDDAYYNMMGQRFNAGSTLPAGIYIHKGKKIIVK